MIRIESSLHALEHVEEIDRLFHLQTRDPDVARHLLQELPPDEFETRRAGDDRLQLGGELRLESRLLCFGHARVAIRPERFPRFASGAEFLRALVATLRSIAPIPLREILALAAR